MGRLFLAVPLDKTPPDTPPSAPAFSLLRLPAGRVTGPRLHLCGQAAATGEGEDAAAVIPLWPLGSKQPPDAPGPSGAEDAAYTARLDELDHLHAELRQRRSAFDAGFARLEAGTPAGEHQAEVGRPSRILARRLSGGFGAQDAELTHFLDP